MKKVSNSIANINPAVLKWARTEMGMDLDLVASKANIKRERLEHWENGLSKPTYNQLKKLALTIYKRPTAVFFRRTIPVENPLEAEFRTIKSKKLHALSTEMRLAIRKAKYLQSQQEELLSLRPAPFSIEEFSLNSSAPLSVSAAAFREFLGLEIQEQLSWKTEYKAFDSIRAKIEESGVGVFQMEFPISEARGLALYGKFPIVVVNESDSILGRIFSLVHETCHILLKTSSIYSENGSPILRHDHIQLEKFCNSFAGEFLLPSEYFLPAVQKFEKQKDEWTDKELGRLAKRFKTSKEVVLRKLVDADLATKRFYGFRKKKWDEEYKAQKEAQKQNLKTSGKQVFGLPAHKRTIAEKGKMYIGRVLHLQSDGKISSFEASRFLDAKMEVIEKIIENLPAK